MRNGSKAGPCCIQICAITKQGRGVLALNKNYYVNIEKRESYRFWSVVFENVDSLHSELKYHVNTCEKHE